MWGGRVGLGGGVSSLSLWVWGDSREYLSFFLLGLPVGGHLSLREYTHTLTVVRGRWGVAAVQGNRMLVRGATFGGVDLVFPWKRLFQRRT